MAIKVSKMCELKSAVKNEIGNHALKRVENISAGDHVCCIYNTDEEHRKLLAPFMSKGLKSNEKTFYIVDTRTSKIVFDYLTGEGLAVEDYLSAGKMSVLTYQETYMKGDVFDPDKMISLLESETSKALAEGYSALRVTGEMTWALRGLPGSEKLMEYESKLNNFFPTHKVVAICQYDARRFSPEILLKVLATHPLAIIGTEIYENFYYVPPEEYLGSDPEGSVFLRSIGNLAKYKQSKMEMSEALEKLILLNEKLGVVGKLTRHDVGNKLMTAKSNVYLLKKRIGDNPDLAKYLDNIDSALTSSDEVFEFSRLYECIGVEKSSSENVFDCFNQAAALVMNSGSVKIVNECQGLEVLADSLIKQLFYNFIDNSLKHGEKVTQIRLHYAKDGDGVKLFYEDKGVGVPEANKARLFEAGFSTGGSTGLGLYLVKKMMDVYGWTITEEGEAGKGAKFVITISKLNKNGKENYQIIQ
jgi:signal transduction histidine kinase